VRGAFLAIDWVIGVGRGAGAVLTPRAHVRNLLGGVAPLDFSQLASAAALVILVATCAALTVLLSRRGARS
jgi:hypothetical protein